MPGDPYLIKNLTDLKINREHITTVPVTNSTSLTVTTGAIGLKLSTTFNLLGHKLSLKSSFNTSSTEANSKSTSTSSKFAAAVAVPANSVYELNVYQETSIQTRLYGLDLVLVSDHPKGSLGKATHNQGIWDTFFRIEDVLKSREKQTI
ncbi:MAG: hypothetical protein J3R72DRAFT_423156 [Linnemannia gamsii]|nr:MAG: hypothetical protein J3R72DRAFT_423156 [Linnemannia gamsii]